MSKIVKLSQKKAGTNQYISFQLSISNEEARHLGWDGDESIHVKKILNEDGTLTLKKIDI